MIKTVLIPATFAYSANPNEVITIAGKNHAAYVSVDKVRLERTPEPGEILEGQVEAYVVEQGKTNSLLELPGVVISALRGRIDNSLIREME